MNLNEAINFAKRVINFSYSPYSKIRVSAVLITKDGKMYHGVNIENSSYGLTICAERVAIFKAISEGEREFKAMIIYSPDVFPWPCGACRQVMAEFFSPTTQVIIVGKKEQKEEKIILKFDDLFPSRYSFKINKIKQN